MLGGRLNGAVFIPWVSWRNYCVGCTQSCYCKPATFLAPAATAATEVLRTAVGQTKSSSSTWR